MIPSQDDFLPVCFINLETCKGRICEYLPQSQYDNVKNYKINKHGKGPFCKFKIPLGYTKKKGVYLIMKNNELSYVGKCIDLQKRFNMGYGNISHKNCFEGGQPTNCKLNAWILSEIKKGSKIELKFLEITDYTDVESAMIQKFRPKLNGRQ